MDRTGSLGSTTRGSVLVLGEGALFDIPLASLADGFERIVLNDF